MATALERVGASGIKRAPRRCILAGSMNVIRTREELQEALKAHRGRLSEVRVEDVDLSGLELSGTFFSALDARFDLANLERAQLPGCDARRARLTHVRGRWVDFSARSRRACDLGDADLEGSVMHRTTLDGARLSGANLDDVARTDDDLSRAERFRPG